MKCPQKKQNSLFRIVKCGLGIPSVSSLESDPKVADLPSNDLYYDAMTLLNEVCYYAVDKSQNVTFYTRYPSFFSHLIFLGL